MRVSHVVAIFLLFLAGLTWLFDQELKRKRERCVDFCVNYEAPRESIELSNDPDQSVPLVRDLANNPATKTPHEMRYFQCGCDGGRFR